MMVNDCPLCGALARCHTGQGNRRRFDCSGCGRFEISLRSEQVLSQSPRSWRESYAQKVRQAPEGYMLVIGMPLSRQPDAVVALADDFVRLQ